MLDQQAPPEPCPLCGASDTKRWKLLDGQDVCDECWMDYCMDRQAQHWRTAKEDLTKVSLRTPCTVAGRASDSKSGQPVPNPLRVRSVVGHHVGYRTRGSTAGLRQGREQDDYRCKVEWREAAAEVLKPGMNSICLICSHIFYGAKMEKCSRCGGLCEHRTDHGLELMVRRALIAVERSDE
jgi:hypothetical protein